jgi:hypothetical protein
MLTTIIGYVSRYFSFSVAGHLICGGVGSDPQSLTSDYLVCVSFVVKLSDFYYYYYYHYYYYLK